MSKRSRGVGVVLALTLVMASGIASFSQNRSRGYPSRYQNASFTVPEGTVIAVRMDRRLSSSRARVGDAFTATVAEPIVVDGTTLIPAGAIIEGHVTQITPAKRMSKPGTLAVDFDELILPSGARMKLIGNLTSDDPDAQKQIDEEGQVSGQKSDRAIFIGGGGAIGAVLGGISGGAKGAVLGGAAGAGIGIAGVLLSKGEEAQVPTGTRFGVQLRQPITITDDQNARSDDPPPARNAGGPDRDVDQGVDNRGSVPPDSRPERASGQEPDRAEDRSPGNEGRVSRPDPVPERTVDRERDNAADRTVEDGRNPAPDNDSPNGDPQTRSNPPAGANLPLSSPEMLRRAQTALRDQGYYEGEIDGQMAPRTASALRSYQREHKLAETGSLDADTAKALGILSPPRAPEQRRPNDSPVDSDGDTRRPGVRDRNERERAPEPPDSGDSELANVVSATATRSPDGVITLVINTQANSGGWRWFGDHVINGDTLEFYARAARSSGAATQALTKGRIEVNIDDGVDYVRRVIVHAAGADLNVTVRNSAASAPVAPASRTTSMPRPASTPSNTPRPASTPSNTPRPASTPSNTPRPASTPSNTPRPVPPEPVASPPAATSIQRQAEEVLADYQRAVGVRLTGSGLEFDPRTQPADDEIELLFALDGFANAAQLYARVLPSLRDQRSLRSAALALSREARRTDRIFSTTSNRTAEALSARWDAIRQDILKLMRSNNISTNDLDI